MQHGSTASHMTHFSISDDHITIYAVHCKRFITSERNSVYLCLPVVEEFLTRFNRVACRRDSMIDASFMASLCSVTSSAASSVSCDVSEVSGC